MSARKNRTSARVSARIPGTNVRVSRRLGVGAVAAVAAGAYAAKHPDKAKRVLLWIAIALAALMLIGMLAPDGDTASTASTTARPTVAMTKPPLPTASPDAALAATAAPTEAPTPAPTQEPTYIGNSGTMKFHKPGCASVADIKDKNKVTFDSRDEATQRGYSPCGRCDP